MNWRLALLLTAAPSACAQVWVDPYYRDDGNRVEGHYRSSPDGIEENNYSYPDNRDSRAYDPPSRDTEPGGYYDDDYFRDLENSEPSYDEPEPPPSTARGFSRSPVWNSTPESVRQESFPLPDPVGVLFIFVGLPMLGVLLLFLIGPVLSRPPVELERRTPVSQRCPTADAAYNKQRQGNASKVGYIALLLIITFLILIVIVSV